MRVFLAGLAIAAAAIGGGLGYAAMQTSGESPWPTAGRRATETATEQTETGVRENGGAIADTRQDLPSQGTASQRPDSPSSDSQNTDASTTSSQPISASDVVITEAELNTMVTEAIATQPYTAPLLDIAKEVNTTLKDGRIESGMVMNIKDIPVDSLPAEGRQAIEQITQTFPFLANREVYLGIEGSPQITNGAFSLDDTNIRFGPLKLPVSSVASQLGISQTDIEQQISAVLEQQGLTPEDIRVSDGQIIISGLPQ